MPLVKSRIEAGEDHDSRVLTRWLKRYGGVGVSSAGHMAEYLPFEPDLHYADQPPFHGTPNRPRVQGTPGKSRHRRRGLARRASPAQLGTAN